MQAAENRTCTGRAVYHKPDLQSIIKGSQVFNRIKGIFIKDFTTAGSNYEDIEKRILDHAGR